MYGGFFFGEPFFGEVQFIESVTPVPPEPVVTKVRGAGPAEGRRAQTRDDAMAKQLAARIRQDDEELIRVIGRIMEDIDP
jgi:hypothetical protein